MEYPFDLKEVSMRIVEHLMDSYWSKIYKTVDANPNLVPIVPGFLVRPKEVVLYFGRTHLGVEYVGHETLATLPPNEQSVQLRWFDFTDDGETLPNKIIGYDYSLGAEPFQIIGTATDLVVPTNTGADELLRLKWNWSAQNMVVALNSRGLSIPAGSFVRIVNGLFFDSDSSGLRTRHIKWLDLIPVKMAKVTDSESTMAINFSVLEVLAESDARKPYPLPEDYKYTMLPRVNRFVEFIGDKTKSEPEITSFLAQPDYQFILLMRFGAIEIHPELLCEWQSGVREPIKPDYFLVGTNGYADIVEFKLPELKGAAVVGTGNRQTFSAELNSYISQTRVYREYFDDPKNREWIEEKFHFKVYKPKRYVILGRRWNFDSQEWKQIEADYDGLNILTYDDIIDGVVAQFYR
jgi:hypothetical protein